MICVAYTIHITHYSTIISMCSYRNKIYVIHTRECDVLKWGIFIISIFIQPLGSIHVELHEKHGTDK